MSCLIEVSLCVLMSLSLIKVHNSDSGGLCLRDCLWGQGRAKRSGFNLYNGLSFISFPPLTSNPDHCDPHGSCWSVSDPKTTQDKMIYPVLLPPPLALIPQQTHIWVNEDKTYKAPNALKQNGWDWYSVTVAVSFQVAHLIYANKGIIIKTICK